MSRFYIGGLGPAAALFCALLPATALGDGMTGENVGRPGKAGAVDRTVEIVMRDNYFDPEAIAVRSGETLRFKVSNRGQLVHEFSLGTASMHRAHQAEMQMLMDHGVLTAMRIDREAAAAMQGSMGHGMHVEANSLLLEPGQSGEIVWTFGPGGTLEFACNVPGHYQAGMQGSIGVE